MRRAALLVTLAACAYWQEETPQTKLASAPVKPQGEALALHLVGSNTIGTSLAPKLVAEYLRKAGATEVKTSQGEGASTVTATRDGRAVTIRVDDPGSGAGFKALADGSANIAMSSRPIKSDEVASLRAVGDMTGSKCEVVIAMDGIAVVVNKTNRVATLTLPQLADVFSGKAKTWSDVGGSGGTIHVFGRDEVSGTYELFTQLVLGGHAPAGVKEHSSEDVVADVSGDKDGVGFVGLSFVKDVKALALQDGDGPPVDATALTVSTESYALSRRLFFYLPEAATAEARSFVQFVLSDDGQDVVAREGFVPLNSAPTDSAIPQNAPEEYRKLLAGAKRLPFDLRFRSGTADLDTKARADLSRAARLAVAYGGSHEIVAIGFADRSGGEPQNVELSRTRAKTVADVLKQIDKRASVQTVGFGSALPVAPNDTERGRERNRRVEVWLR